MKTRVSGDSDGSKPVDMPTPSVTRARHRASVVDTTRDPQAHAQPLGKQSGRTSQWSAQSQCETQQPRPGVRGAGKQPTLRSQHCSCQTPAGGGEKPWRIHDKLFFTHKEESCLATRMHLRHVTGSEPRKPVTEDHLGHHPIDMKCPESANLGTEGGSRMRFSAGAGGRKLVGAGMGPMRTRTVGS